VLGFSRRRLWYKKAAPVNDENPSDGTLDKLTLREASDRTGLSITTLRRYIRSGRLKAEKSPGRYGPEYFVSLADIQGAAIRIAAAGPRAEDEPVPESPSRSPVPAPSNGRSALAAGASTAPSGGWLPETLVREMVPIDLYRELSMKHEQLLVQYGMVRVGGQRLMEYRAEAEQLAEKLRRAEDAAQADRERVERELGFMKKHLRQAELELEERNQEIVELREKIKILEVISRNAITSESIEEQFLQVFDKRREIGEISPASSSDERRRRLAALDDLLKSGFRVPPREPTDQ
jgi:hypothetical protein